jgi:hypothetical protein
MGPYSPARGTHTGFRFDRGRLGTRVGPEWWSMIESPGTRKITQIVIDTWGGGRILFLPNGYVVKPLPGPDEVGKRALIGLFTGPVVLKRPHGALFDLGQPGTLRPGQSWLGPTTTGLECAIRSDGTLVGNWCHPTQWGQDNVSENLRGPDRLLADGFRTARPGDTDGRVRVTANGHIITNRSAGSGDWEPIYVGHVERTEWTKWNRWILKETV